MGYSSIDVAPDVVGETIPGSVRPVAVRTVNGADVQAVLTEPESVPHDHKTITWTGNLATKIEYRQGGASGLLVMTADITYDGNDNPTAISYTFA